MRLLSLLVLVVFSLIGVLQAKEFTASNSKSEKLSISYDEYSGIIQIDFSNQAGVKNEPLFVIGVKTKESLEIAISNLLRGNQYVQFANSIEEQLEAYLAGRCEIDLDNLSGVIEKDLLEKQIKQIKLRSEEKGLHESKLDPVILKDDLVNYEFVTYGRLGEISRIRLFSGEKLILNQPLAVGRNQIHKTLRNKYLQVATKINGNIDSHHGGLLTITSFVYANNGNGNRQITKQVVLKKQPNGLFESDIQVAPLAPFQHNVFSSAPAVNGTRNGGAIEQKKPRLFAKKFQQKIYKTIMGQQDDYEPSCE